ncbi:hypothetical protein ACTWQB_08820 [Piscibacillus sp. B03]|uniref:hypothetical protein n=1 Tax=Piscibacillus sp. B03 TaxID=3457430 RepID=UPI003FCD2B9F
MRILVLFLLLLSTGCTSGEGEEQVKPNPTPSSILQENPEADILYVNGIVYKNASDIEWVVDSDYEKGDDLGIVEKQVKDPEGFRDLTATHLLVGTPLYEAENVSGDVIVAETDEGDLPYLALKEG